MKRDRSLSPSPRDSLSLRIMHLSRLSLVASHSRPVIPFHFHLHLRPALSTSTPPPAGPLHLHLHLRLPPSTSAGALHQHLQGEGEERLAPTAAREGGALATVDGS